MSEYGSSDHERKLIETIQDLRAQLAEAHALLREACKIYAQFRCDEPLWVNTVQIPTEWYEAAKKEVGE